MSGTSLNPDDVRAAAETHRELGPDYQSAVIESFLDKVGREIDARVDARLASSVQPAQSAQPAVRSVREHGPFTLAVVSLIAAIPLSAIAMANGPGDTKTLFVVWLGIVIVNVAYALHLRPPRR